MKSVRILSYSSPHFPVFRLNTERYYVSLRIQSECGKLRTRITPTTDTFYVELYSFYKRHLFNLEWKYKFSECHPNIKFEYKMSKSEYLYRWQNANVTLTLKNNRQKLAYFANWTKTEINFYWASYFDIQQKEKLWRHRR